MALIEYFDGYTGIFVDGYIPERDVIVDIAESRIGEKLEGEIQPYKLFCNQFWRVMEELNIRTSPFNDIYFLKKSRRDRTSPLGAWICKFPQHKEYGKDPDLYRMIIVIYHPGLDDHYPGTDDEWQNVSQDLKKILGELKFEIKDEKEYENYPAFKDFVECALGDCIEKFTAPCIQARKYLEDSGFDSLYV